MEIECVFILNRLFINWMFISLNNTNFIASFTFSPLNTVIYLLEFYKTANFENIKCTKLKSNLLLLFFFGQ